MPIDIICPGCRTRFKVNDKFAGQKGPCPKCKTVIQIPAAGEEVVVHAPDQFGPKDSKGVGVLKPISRSDARVSPVMIVGIISAVFVVLICALLMRGMEEIPAWILGFGALVLAPPLVWAGYTFLRDDELEPHRGRYLAIRVAVCSVVYAVLWGAYVWLPSLVFDLGPLELFHLLFILPPIMIVGGLAAFASLDLDFGTGVIHYGFYLLVTVALSFIMGLSLLGTPAENEQPRQGEPQPVSLRRDAAATISAARRRSHDRRRPRGIPAGVPLGLICGPNGLEPIGSAFPRGSVLQ